MKILQSTIERLLYILLALMFVAVIVIGIIAYRDGQEVKQIINDHTQVIQREEQQTEEIEKNQLTNSTALKDYIACLLTLTPTGDMTLQAQEQTCFNNAPEVK